MREEAEAKRKMEEEDRIAAYNLQKEEVQRSSGKRLRVPSEHKIQLNTLFQKSPKKLRSYGTRSESIEPPKMKKQRTGEFSGRSCS